MDLLQLQLFVRLLIDYQQGGWYIQDSIKYY